MFEALLIFVIFYDLLILNNIFYKLNSFSQSDFQLRPIITKVIFGQKTFLKKIESS